MAKSQELPPDVNALGDTFGDDVRRVREARRISQQGLSLGTGYSRSYVSKVETNVVIPTEAFARGCDRTFGTGDLFVRQLRRRIEGEVPGWFAPHVEAEREAEMVRDFSTLFVAGLLQTPEYARASLSACRPCPPDDLEALVLSRMRRSEILDRSTPPTVWVVLCEAALWSQVGSARVMANQMRHILVMTRKYRMLTVQVLPYSRAAVALSTPYVLLDGPGGKPCVYVEGPQGGRRYDSPDIVANTVRDYDQLRAESLGPYESAAYIENVRSEHERNAVDSVQSQRQARRQLRRVGAGARVRRQRPGAGQ